MIHPSKQVINHSHHQPENKQPTREEEEKRDALFRVSRVSSNFVNVLVQMYGDHSNFNNSSGNDMNTSSTRQEASSSSSAENKGKNESTTATAVPQRRRRRDPSRKITFADEGNNKNSTNDMNDADDLRTPHNSAAASSTLSSSVKKHYLHQKTRDPNNPSTYSAFIDPRSDDASTIFFPSDKHLRPMNPGDKLSDFYRIPGSSSRHHHMMNNNNQSSQEKTFFPTAAVPPWFIEIEQEQQQQVNNGETDENNNNNNNDDDDDDFDWLNIALKNLDAAESNSQRQFSSADVIDQSRRKDKDESLLMKTGLSSSPPGNRNTNTSSSASTSSLLLDGANANNLSLHPLHRGVTFISWTPSEKVLDYMRNDEEFGTDSERLIPPQVERTVESIDAFHSMYDRLIEVLRVARNSRVNRALGFVPLDLRRSTRLIMKEEERLRNEEGNNEEDQTMLNGADNNNNNNNNNSYSSSSTAAVMSAMMMPTTTSENYNNNDENAVLLTDYDELYDHARSLADGRVAAQLMDMLVKGIAALSGGLFKKRHAVVINTAIDNALEEMTFFNQNQNHRRSNHHQQQQQQSSETISASNNNSNSKKDGTEERLELLSLFVLFRDALEIAERDYCDEKEIGEEKEESASCTINSEEFLLRRRIQRELNEMAEQERKRTQEELKKDSGKQHSKTSSFLMLDLHKSKQKKQSSSSSKSTTTGSKREEDDDEEEEPIWIKHIADSLFEYDPTLRVDIENTFLSSKTNSRKTTAVVNDDGENDESEPEGQSSSSTSSPTSSAMASPTLSQPSDDDDTKEKSRHVIKSSSSPRKRLVKPPTAFDRYLFYKPRRCQNLNSVPVIKSPVLILTLLMARPWKLMKTIKMLLQKGGRKKELKLQSMD